MDAMKNIVEELSLPNFSPEGLSHCLIAPKFATCKVTYTTIVTYFHTAFNIFAKLSPNPFLTIVYPQTKVILYKSNNNLTN